MFGLASLHRLQKKNHQLSSHDLLHLISSPPTSVTIPCAFTHALSHRCQEGFSSHDLHCEQGMLCRAGEFTIKINTRNHHKKATSFVYFSCQSSVLTTLHCIVELGALRRYKLQCVFSTLSTTPGSSQAEKLDPGARANKPVMCLAGGSPQAELRPGSLPTTRIMYDQGAGWLAGWLAELRPGSPRSLGWLAGWLGGWLAG